MADCFHTFLSFETSLSAMFGRGAVMLSYAFDSVMEMSQE
jgi:hypothetical protein